DRGRPEALDVAELLAQAGEVAAVEVALAGGVEAVVGLAAGDAAVVVARVAVEEAVGHHEVEALASERRAQAVVGGERRGPGRGLRRRAGAGGGLVGDAKALGAAALAHARAERVPAGAHELRHADADAEAALLELDGPQRDRAAAPAQREPEPHGLLVPHGP